MKMKEVLSAWCQNMNCDKCEKCFGGENKVPCIYLRKDGVTYYTNIAAMQVITAAIDKKVVGM